MHFRPAFTRACAGILCSLALVLHGQQALKNDKPLTTVKELRALDPHEAGEHPRAARLRGVVLMSTSTRGGFLLHDGSESLLVVLATKDTKCPDTGDEVEVEGETRSYQWGFRSRPQVWATQVTVTGKAAALPLPRPATDSELKIMGQLDQWVTTEGQVIEWMYEMPFLSLVLLSKDGLMWVMMRVPDAARVPADLSGAIVRATGLNTPFGTSSPSVISPGIEQLEIIAPGHASLFDIPEVTMPDVLDRKIPIGSLVRTRGIVTGNFGANRPIICASNIEDGAMIVELRPVRNSDKPGARYGQPAEWPVLEPGDLIEVVGALMASSERSGLGLAVCYARHVGKAEVPRARHVEMHELFSKHRRDEWASVDGVVTGWSLQGDHMAYAVTSPRMKSIFTIRAPAGYVFPEDLHGATLRFTGLWFGGSRLPRDDVFAPPDTNHVEVIKPGARDPFAAPETTIEHIVREEPEAGRVRTHGVVVGITEGPLLHLRGEHDCMVAQMQLPWHRPKDSASMRFADSGRVPAVKVGDEVEVVGSPVRSSPRAEVQECDLIETQLRVRSKGNPVSPLDAAVGDVVRGQHTADLVRVRGRLLAVQELPSKGGRWRSTLMVEADGRTLPVIHESAQQMSLATLRIDDEVLVSGLVQRATSEKPRHLQMLDAADVKSLGLAPSIVRQRVWMWGGSAVALLILLATWIIALNRSVRYRTAELREAQSRLEQALHHERELGELKSRFVSMVSHEFRTPLGVVMSAGDVLDRYFDRLDPEKRRKHLEMILRSSRQLADIMDEVLLLGRVEEGRMLFKPEPVDLASLCRSLCDELKSATHDICPIVVDLRGDLGGAVSDESLLRHILVNLISNAVKYSPPGTPVDFSVERLGNDARFVIADHGIGIPENDRERLFSSFNRGSNVGQRPGTGLGLVIVKRCVDLHGGTVSIESEAGKGTTVTVVLPLFK